MCGRYFRRPDKKKPAGSFHLGNLDELVLELSQSYNIAPTTMQRPIDLLGPFDGDLMKPRKVDQDVGNVGNNVADILKTQSA